jgi:hypothetical protein
MATIRIILSIVVSRKWCLRQLDMQNVFLHDILKEDVYMKQPPGYVGMHHLLHVCKLDKALYGLKQAPKAWYNILSSKLVQLGFVICKADTSLFIYNKNSITIYLLVYDNEIIVVKSSLQVVTTLLHHL